MQKYRQLKEFLEEDDSGYHVGWNSFRQDCRDLLADRVVLMKALKEALTELEDYAETIEAEYGQCRDIKEMETDGSLPESILNVRAIIAAMYNE